MSPPQFDFHPYYRQYGFFLKESLRMECGKYVTPEMERGLKPVLRNMALHLMAV